MENQRKTIFKKIPKICGNPRNLRIEKTIFHTMNAFQRLPPNPQIIFLICANLCESVDRKRLFIPRIRFNVSLIQSQQKSFQSFLILEICDLDACSFHKRALARHAYVAQNRINQRSHKKCLSGKTPTGIHF
jgi:hypothetical protein